MFTGLDLYYADPAQHLTTVGEELDYLDHDLSDLSVGGVNVSGIFPSFWERTFMLYLCCSGRQ